MILPLRNASRASSWSEWVEREEDELLEDEEWDEDDWLEDADDRLSAAAACGSAVTIANRKASRLVIAGHVAAGCQCNLGASP